VVNKHFVMMHGNKKCRPSVYDQVLHSMMLLHDFRQWQHFSCLMLGPLQHKLSHTAGHQKVLLSALSQLTSSYATHTGTNKLLPVCCKAVFWQQHLHICWPPHSSAGSLDAELATMMSQRHPLWTSQSRIAQCS